MDELSPDAPWLASARTTRERDKEARGLDANAHMDARSAAAPTFASYARSEARTAD